MIKIPRNIKIFVAFCVTCIFLFTGNIVNAATPTPTPLDGWEESYYCDSSINREKFTSVNVLIQSPYDNDKAKFYTDKNLDKYCVNQDEVGTLYDYKDKRVGYCPKGTVTAIEAVDNVSGILYLRKGNRACCPIVSKPSGTRYLVSEFTNTGGKLVNDPLILFDLYCCDSPEKIISPTQCTSGIVPQTPQDSIDAGLGELAFPTAVPVFSCPNSACFYSKEPGPNDWEESNDTRTNLIDTTGYKCVASIDMSGNSDAPANAPAGNYCFDGEVYTPEEFKKYKGILGAINSCKQFVDPKETEACLKCYEHCANQTECSLNYSALGCIDTTPSGLITRVFQIGIGIVGLVGILQIMYAAYLRQTADPAKIQESWEIIGSLLMGIVLLLGASMILRFIGINVLGVLPFDFLQ